MRLSYELSKRAASDIEDILRYTIENFGLEQADEYATGLYHSFDLLLDNPRLGRSYAGGTFSATSTGQGVFGLGKILFHFANQIINFSRITVQHTMALEKLPR